MKNPKIIGVVVVLVLIIVGIMWFGGDSGESKLDIQDPLAQVTSSSTNSVLPVSETTKVSGGLSQYQNAELGLSVKYPTTWEKEETNSGVRFIIPIDASQVSTVAKLEADINVTASKCAFPPVTTVDERSVMKVGDMSFNMISMSNTVQGRSYFNRMYSYQKGAICYVFGFAEIALSPESKGLTGSNLTQAQNNNKAILNTADTAFTAMVKTLTFVAPPAGKDEVGASPVKK